MYDVDSKDEVVEQSVVPQSSVGAPCPMILAGEHRLLLAYFLEDFDEETTGEAVALVEFERPYAHMFGPPNDEAFDGHPLASRGLEPYQVSEIRHSSWIRQLERMNAVHECHRADFLARYRHFIFAFHDSTFECVAKSFSVRVHTGSVAEVLESAFRERHP